MWCGSECRRKFFIIKKVKISIRLSWILSANFINFTMELLSTFYFIYYLPFADGKAIFISFPRNEKKEWRKIAKSFTKLLICGKRKNSSYCIDSWNSFIIFISRLIAIKKVFQLFSFLIKIIVTKHQHHPSKRKCEDFYRKKFNSINHVIGSFHESSAKTQKWF